jgi:hypothetical protein
MHAARGVNGGDWRWRVLARSRTFLTCTLLASSWSYASKATAAPAAGHSKFGKTGTGLGIGASVGDPLGFSIKYFVRPQHALSGHVAYGLLHHGDGLVTVDYHWHTRPIGDSPIVQAMFYVGVGVGVAFWARPGPGALQGHERAAERGAGLILRAPALGLAYHWTRVPIDTAIELAWSPYIVMPDLRHLDASVKVRYFF